MSARWQKAISVGLLAVALSLAALALVSLVYAAVFVLPNDQRVVFSFPEITGPAARAAVSYDFIARADDARRTGPPEGAAPPAVVQAVLQRGPHSVRRRALNAPPGTEYEYALTVPARGWVQFHFGAVAGGKPSGGTPSRVRFVVEAASPDRGVEVIFSTIVAPGAAVSARRPRGALRRWLLDPFQVNSAVHQDPWIPASVPLKSWEGQSIRLRFRTEPVFDWDEDDGAPDPALPQQPLPDAYWAGPVLFAPSAAVPAGSDNLILIVSEAARWDALGAHVRGALTPQLDRLVHEGMDFQRVYANALTGPASLDSLLSGRAPSASAAGPSLAAALKREGYRTAAVGSFRSPPEDGFDEVHDISADGYEPVRIARRASEWLAAYRSAEPFFLVVYLPSDPPGASIPLRFWPRGVAGPARGFDADRWRHRARLAYVDDYAGLLFDVMDACQTWDRSLVALVSTEGAEYRDRPGGLSEPSVRVVWTMRHRSLPQGRSLSEPVQLFDLPPTLLRLLGEKSAAAAFGQGLDVSSRGVFRAEEAPPVRLFSSDAKGLIVDHHFKYVRRARRGPDGAPLFPAEEVYDLWTDPGEERNLVRRERNLLAKMRRALNETDPDATETVLRFWDLGGRVVKGGVESPAGELVSFWTDGAVLRRGKSEFDFEVASSSGEVRFQIWPPGSPFVLRVLIDGKYFSTEQIRASRFGLPLFERSGQEWYDHTAFPWLQGIAEPRPDDRGPLMFMGRRPADVALGVDTGRGDPAEAGMTEEGDEAGAGAP